MTNANESANPIFLQNGLTHDCHVDIGLTKREYFAAMAMQGLLSNPEHRKEYKGKTYLMESNIYSDQAVNLADSLIEALNKTEK